MTMATPFPHLLPTETEVDDHGHIRFRKVSPGGHGQVTYTPLRKGGR